MGHLLSHDSHTQRAALQHGLSGHVVAVLSGLRRNKVSCDPDIRNHGAPVGTSKRLTMACQISLNATHLRPTQINGTALENAPFVRIFLYAAPALR